RPGANNLNLETLIRLASAFKVGLIVRFAPFSEMLHWENSFMPDAFDVTKLEKDKEFLEPAVPQALEQTQGAEKRESVQKALNPDVTSNATKKPSVSSFLQMAEKGSANEAFSGNPG